jgi:phospholipid/cholesterol/gamma-HCH transport system permease protein
MQFEFLPRILGGIASVIGLTVLGSVLTLFLAYFSIYGISAAGFEAFSNTISTVFSVGVLMGLGVKCVFFGLALTTLPMAAGLETPKKLFMVPVSVLRGMMRVFLALVLIEVVSLALEYI